MQRRAFTLIELLVVMAVIAALAGVLIAAVQRAQVGAKQTACSSNMRQLGLAILTYCNEHDGNFPESAHTDEARSWVFTLAPYLNNLEEIRICPADPRAEQRKGLPSSSYVLNEYIVVPKVGPFTRSVENFSNLRRIPFPTKTMLVFIGSDRMDLGVSNDHTHSRNWGKWDRVLDDIQPDRHRVGSANRDHTGGSANYLYADGHVETMEATRLKAFFDQGLNVACPPQEVYGYQLK